MPEIKPSLTVNGIDFTPRPDCNYRNNYGKFLDIGNHPKTWEKVFPGVTGLTKESVERALLRHLILEDLWFVCYFLLGIQSANHPFVVNYARQIEDGPQNRTLDVVSRGHFKTSLRTKARTIQRILKHPERATIIFSYKKPLAEKFLSSIKQALESDFLKTLFPEVLYTNPDRESPSWSVQNGITVKRKNNTRSEPSVYASGLTEGMATGFHAEHRIYDDVETGDMAGSMDVMNDCFEKFELSSFLGTKTDADTEEISGTFYHWEGPLAKIQRLKAPDGSPLYHSRIIPGTHDGQPNGKPVFWSQSALDSEKTKSGYFSQVLCDPQPKTTRSLKPELLQRISHRLIPRNVHRFMVIDPAGTDGGGDSWAMLIVGIEPKVDDLGASRVFILDADIEPYKQSEAIESMIRMYINGGTILKTGIEKVGQSSFEIHAANALAARGRRITVDNGTLEILRPGGRGKADRIEAALSWPLNNSKLYCSDAVPDKYFEKLKAEMSTFPYGHDDGIDAFSYVFDMIKGHRFTVSDEGKVYHRKDVNTASVAGY